MLLAHLCGVTINVLLSNVQKMWEFSWLLAAHALGLLRPVPTQMLAAVLCRGIWVGGDESCPASEDSWVKLWTLLSAKCVSSCGKQVTCWFPGVTKNALCLLLPLFSAVPSWRKKSWLAQVAPCPAFNVFGLICVWRPRQLAAVLAWKTAD